MSAVTASAKRQLEQATTELGPDRLAALARAKLRALVHRRFPDIGADAQSFSAGVDLIDDDRIFVYLTGDGPSAVAAALARADNRGVSDIHVVLDEADAVLAAMVAGFEPSPALWLVDGTDLVPMPADRLPPPMEVPAAAEALRSTLGAAGCDTVVEHGVVLGEVCGLEVARVVLGPDGMATLRVGVGMYDQEAHALLSGGAPLLARLEEVIELVSSHRRRDSMPHPLNREARGRWLRSLLVHDPSLLGLSSLRPIEPLIQREGIRDEVPAAALGVGGAETVLVVCSTGVDLDLVTTAAAHAGTHGAERIVLVLPDKDRLGVIERMAARTTVPTTFASIADPWPG